jgi:hypothetical protein
VARNSRHVHRLANGHVERDQINPHYEPAHVMGGCNYQDLQKDGLYGLQLIVAV